jgi:hypothetical protein
MSRLTEGATQFSTPMAHIERTHPDALVIIVGGAFLVFYVALRRGWRPKPRRRLSARGVKGVRVRPLALLPSVLLLIVLIVLLVSHGG